MSYRVTITEELGVITMLVVRRTSEKNGAADKGTINEIFISI